MSRGRALLNAKGDNDKELSDYMQDITFRKHIKYEVQYDPPPKVGKLGPRRSVTKRKIAEKKIKL